MEPCLTMATPMAVANADSKARQGRGGVSAAGARAVKALRLYDCLVLPAPHAECDHSRSPGLALSAPLLSLESRLLTLTNEF